MNRPHEMAQIKAELAAHADPEPRRVILVLAANPLDTERLRLDAEVRAIDEQLRQGEGDYGFGLHQQWAVRSGDLIDEMGIRDSGSSSSATSQRGCCERTGRLTRSSA